MKFKHIVASLRTTTIIFLLILGVSSTYAQDKNQIVNEARLANMLKEARSVNSASANAFADALENYVSIISKDSPDGVMLQRATAELALALDKLDAVDKLQIPLPDSADVTLARKRVPGTKECCECLLTYCCGAHECRCGLFSCSANVHVGVTSELRQSLYWKE